MLVRQAHPGPRAPAYRSFAAKMEDARSHKAERAIPYPVLVDDLAGSTHQAYGGLADPTYLIDADGRVAFYDLWTHVPTVHRAITQLMRQAGRGVVLGGISRAIRPLATIANGWEGLEKGWPQSAIELERAVPGFASSPWIGAQLRPALAPIALRDTPLPLGVRMGLLAGVIAAAAGAGAWIHRRAATTDASS